MQFQLAFGFASQKPAAFLVSPLENKTAACRTNTSPPSRIVVLAAAPLQTLPHILVGCSNRTSYVSLPALVTIRYICASATKTASIRILPCIVGFSSFFTAVLVFCRWQDQQTRQPRSCALRSLASSCTLFLWVGWYTWLCYLQPMDHH